ncbi:hypothetical protein PFISCL1PPCAC_10371, partial [Pristionchus fissidentatus]
PLLLLLLPSVHFFSSSTMSGRLGGGSSSRRVPLLLLPSLLSLSLLILLPSFALSLHICNGGTDYACICDNSTDSPPSSPSPSPSPSPSLSTPSLPLPSSSVPPCSHFIEPSSLPSVDMRVRHVNLDAPRHGNEKYERYFKKRIATIVSSYCERQTNECPGTALVLNPDGSRKRGKSRPSDAVLYAIDDDDPLLSQDNVILLRTQKEPQNITRILFNVVKSPALAKGAPLNEDNILDPVKVKYILGSQPAPLARILGGVKVESVRVNNVHGSEEDGAAALTQAAGPKGNGRLMWMMSIVGAFFVICYCIGGYRLYSDCQKRKKKKKATESTQMVDKERETQLSPNYGSMVTAQPNGSTVVTVTEDSRLIVSPVIGTSYTRPSSAAEAASCRPRAFSDRTARLMFGCDLSQLPKEASIDMGLDQMPPSEHQGLESVPPPPTTPPLPSLHQSSIPAVVLLSSHSLSRDSPLVDPLLSSSPIIDPDSLPSHRPKSRRGSRVDDGIETLDLTERTVPEPELNEDTIRRRLEKRSTDEAWSSSEGEVDVYYKLSEEEAEAVKGDDWPNGLRQVDDPSNVVIFSPPRKNREIMDDSSDEEMEEETKEASIDIRDDDDIHGYERLREESSPLPPPAARFSIEDDDDMR